MTQLKVRLEVLINTEHIVKQEWEKVISVCAVTERGETVEKYLMSMTMANQLAASLTAHVQAIVTRQNERVKGGKTIDVKAGAH